MIICSLYLLFLRKPKLVVKHFNMCHKSLNVRSCMTAGCGKTDALQVVTCKKRCLFCKGCIRDIVKKGNTCPKCQIRFRYVVFNT